MPGIVAVVDHRLDTVISLDVVADRITAVRVVRSPEKLRAMSGKIFPKSE